LQIKKGVRNFEHIGSFLLGRCSAFVHKMSTSGAGIYELMDADVLLYPNPTSGAFTIETKKVEEGSRLKIFNSIGQLLVNQSIEELLIPVDLKQYQAGFFEVQLIHKNGESYYSKKIIVID
jgi:Secretion system C-terminal sorting domain